MESATRQDIVPCEGHCPRSSQDESPLIALPAEIIQMMLELCLVSREALCAPPRLQVQLLRACQVLYRLGRDILFQKNTIVVEINSTERHRAFVPLWRYEKERKLDQLVNFDRLNKKCGKALLAWPRIRIRISCSENNFNENSVFRMTDTFDKVVKYLNCRSQNAFRLFEAEFTDECLNHQSDRRVVRLSLAMLARVIRHSNFKFINSVGATESQLAALKYHVQGSTQPVYRNEAINRFSALWDRLPTRLQKGLKKKEVEDAISRNKRGRLNQCIHQSVKLSTDCMARKHKDLERYLVPLGTLAQFKKTI